MVAPRVVIGAVHAVQVGKVAHHFIGRQAIVQARVAGEKAEVFAHGLTLCYGVVSRDRYAAEVGLSMVAIIRNAVVLPAPLGPNNAKTRPG